MALGVSPQILCDTRHTAAKRRQRLAAGVSPQILFGTRQSAAKRRQQLTMVFVLEQVFQSKFDIVPLQELNVFLLK